MSDREREIDGLIAELRALEHPERGRRRLPPGWEVITGGGAVLVGAAVAGGRGVRRHWRPVAAAATGTAGAAIVATALLAHGSPVPRSHAGAPPARPTATVSAPAPSSAGPSLAPSTGGAPTAVPKLGHSGTGVPAVPVLVPSRIRRPSTSPSQGAGSSPAGPSPTPTRPGPSLSHRRPPPTPSPPMCPVGLTVVLLGIRVYICV